jgi:DNA replication initiation complex subunit (GINS family)
MDIISTLEDGSRKLGRYFSRAEDLMKIRQGKIFAVSRVGNSLNVTQNLSEEEKVLLDSLSSHISDWRVFLLDSKRKIK